MRKYIVKSMLLAACLLCVLAGAVCEVASERPADWMGETAQYEREGVIWRVSARPRTRALITELEVAYVDFEMPYLIVGERAEWSIAAAGGDGAYMYEFGLYYRAGTEGSLSRVGYARASDKNEFSHDIERAGHYMLLVTVSDSSGKELGWQSQIFEAYEPGLELDETTVPGKVNALAIECMREAGDSEYARALWLHDYLIYNANYDYTYTYYYADGVLLRGTGVCQSYALAYDMLLKRVGIECVYITGTAGGGGHGWNLARLDGEWYHIDATWDDPGSGGGENHNYFAITDAQMSRDHVWANTEGVMPKCEDTDNGYRARAGYTVVTDTQSLNQALDALLYEGGVFEAYSYAGADGSFQLVNEIAAWIDSNEQSFAVAEAAAGGTKYEAYIRINYTSGYLPIVEAPIELVPVSDTYLLVPDQIITPMLCAVPDYVWKSIGGGRYQLSPVDLNELGVTYLSSDESVVKVSGAYLTAIAPGRADITARCVGGAECAFTVYVHVDTSDIIEFAHGVTRIEQEAFENCVSLYNISLPETLAYIGARAFADCASLNCVWMPSGSIQIEDDAFENCPLAVFYCVSGSDAHTFASDKGYEIVIVD